MRAITLLPLVLCSLLAGCPDRKEPQHEAVAGAVPAGPAERAAAPVSEAGLTFSVTREDGGGLDAKIFEVLSETETREVVEVPASGVVQLPQPCSQGQSFKAIPVVQNFELAAPQPCAARVDFVLLAPERTFSFMKAGDDAFTAGNFQLAQENFGRAADRIQYSSPKEAQRLRLLSTAAAGRVLGVENPVTTTDENGQPTMEFKDRVRQFQRENGIAETGELDSNTRSSIGRMKMQGAAVVVPPAAVVEAAPAIPSAAMTEYQPRTDMNQVLITPASPQTAEMIRANRLRAAAQRQ
jgi:hypothetical protein